MKTFYVTGDCHRDFTRFETWSGCGQDTAVIILGDAGINYLLDRRDDDFKDYLAKFDITFYCVKGNHEARPSSVEGMHLVFDPEVNGEIWMQDQYPNIRYFKEFGIYSIPRENGDPFKVAVVGGAYSVDKWYRLANNRRWFADEQLTDIELTQCYEQLGNQDFDFVLTHTCPKYLMPTDLFLQGIDQSLVDNNMETFLRNLSYMMNWKVWLFGHYHADRIEQPHVEQLYYDIKSFEAIWNEWRNYDINPQKLHFWHTYSPKFGLYGQYVIGYKEI